MAYDVSEHRDRLPRGKNVASNGRIKYPEARIKRVTSSGAFSASAIATDAPQEWPSTIAAKSQFV